MKSLLLEIGLTWNNLTLSNHCIFRGWLEKVIIFTKKSDFFYLNQIFLIFSISIFVPTFYQIFETGLSAQSRKQHGHHNSGISSYTLAEQKVSTGKQQLIKVLLPWLYM